MKPEITTPSAEDASALSPYLDLALAVLSQTDRDAIVLRFLQQKSIHDVAAIVGISEDAAQKRIARALEKIRKRFTRNGITLSAAALAILLAATPLLAAPPALIPTTTAAALTTSPLISAPGLSIAKGAMRMMFFPKLHAAATLAGITALLAAFAFPLLHRSFAQSAPPPLAEAPASPLPPVTPRAATPPTTNPAETTIISLPNAAFQPRVNPDGYAAVFDPAVRRTPDSPPSLQVRSIAPNPWMGGWIYESNAKLLDPFRGKRVRLSAWIKTTDVSNWAGLQFDLTSRGKIVSHDDMASKPASGTTDWRQYDSIAQVPNDLAAVKIYIILHGPGQIWFDNTQIQLAPAEAPLTDDHLWHKSSPVPLLYEVAPDPAVQHNGHAAYCLSADFDARRQYGSYEITNRFVEKFAGHRVSFTIWLKSEDILTGSGPIIWARDASERNIAGDASRGHRPVRRTQEWKPYTVYADIPPSATSIVTGFILNGSGKLWADLNSAQLQLADPATSPSP
jgi:hypothetical protein